MKKVLILLNVLVVSCVLVFFGSRSVSAEIYTNNNDNISFGGDNYGFSAFVSTAYTITERNQYYAFYVGNAIFDTITLTCYYDGDSWTYSKDYDYFKSNGYIVGNYAIINLIDFPDISNNWRVDLTENPSFSFSISWFLNLGSYDNFSTYQSPGVFQDEFMNNWSMFATNESAINGDYFSGYSDGINVADGDIYSSGYEDGKVDGYNEAVETYSNDYTNGYDEGIIDGKDEGYDEGYDDGSTFDNSSWLKTMFFAIGWLFSIELLPNVSIGLIASMLLFIRLLPFILGLFKGGSKD